MDIPDLSLPYRRVITYSSRDKQMRRLKKSIPASSDSVVPEPEMKELENQNTSDSEENKSTGGQKEPYQPSDVEDKAVDKPWKKIIEAHSCPICLELAMPPFFLVAILCAVTVSRSSALST
ncbi:hypothetical protein K435DRAFT_793288 [Dendrothele bispora CBS 962.96]|uniref:Uncharacterized protein n=1 Tax=Dendrothele bispora (strain CBS 962.96) TaxID=1314807 RepID=A0A4S8MH65_DENBC|nr:hypothetical protein K435DRAFT_793288 [Dendrothele bispora CBS 962.96]